MIDIRLIDEESSINNVFKKFVNRMELLESMETL